MGIKSRFTLLIVIALIIMLTLEGIVTLFIMKKGIENSLANFRLHSSQSLVENFDVDSYKKWLENPTENDIYWVIRNSLNEFRANSGQLYVYTYAIENGEPFIMIDGQPKGSELASEIYEPSPSHKKEMIRAYEGEITTTSIDQDSDYGDYLSTFLPIKDKDGKIIGGLGLDTDASILKNVSNEVINQELPLFLSLSIGIFICCIIIFNIFIGKITAPILATVKHGERMAEGDFSNDVPHAFLNRKDEIGTLAHCFAHITKNMRSMIKQVQHSAEQSAASAQELSASAEETEKSSSQIAFTINEIAQGTTLQTNSISDVLTKMDEVVKEVTEGNKKSVHALNNAKQSTMIAHNGNTAIQEAIQHLSTVTKTVAYATDSIQKLGKRSEEIGGIITVITQIADQTNLLALNAAIEAARAGEHGKGFAVVAEEVRKLAEQSSESAGKITNLIKDIQAETVITVRTMESNLDAVEEQVGIIQKGGEALNLIVQKADETELDAKISQEILLIIEKYAQAVLSSIHEISGIIEQSAAATEQVSAAAEEQSATVAEIASSSHELAKMAENLQDEIHKFKI